MSDQNPDHDEPLRAALEAEVIEDASISPNGEWVYFGTCCEPAAGTVFRVRTDGSSEPERISLGYDPAPDPSGSWLAIADSAFSRIVVTDLEGAALWELPLPDASVADPSWSPDGRRVAFTAQEAGGSRTVVVVDFDPELATGFGTPRTLEGITPSPRGSATTASSASSSTVGPTPFRFVTSPAPSMAARCSPSWTMARWRSSTARYRQAPGSVRSPKEPSPPTGSGGSSRPGTGPTIRRCPSPVSLRSVSRRRR